jgi:hypothetical protein
MKNFRNYYFFIIILIFQGCSKKVEKKDIKSLKKEKLDYQQILAQHSEIPDVLLGFDVVSIKKSLTDPQGLEVIYKSVKNRSFNQEEIKKSYVADMEMLGWKMIGEFDGDTIQLIFQKAGTKLLSTITISQDLFIKVIVYPKK